MVVYIRRTGEIPPRCRAVARNKAVRLARNPRRRFGSGLVGALRRGDTMTTYVIGRIIAWILISIAVVFPVIVFVWLLWYFGEHMPAVGFALALVLVFLMILLAT